MNERLEEPKTEELIQDHPDESVPVSEPVAEEKPVPWVGPAWLRLAYAFEFLIALVTIFTVWSQVGGQGHLDLMAWYIKLGLSFAMAWCIVRFTAAMVEHEKSWNAHSAMWLAWMILFAAAMGGVTYYYHIHEVPDESDTDENSSTSVHAPAWRDPMDNQTVLHLPGMTVIFPGDRING